MRTASAIAMALAIVATQPASAGDQDIKDSLKRVAPKAVIASINPIPVKGFKEIVVDNQVLYMSDDGRYLFDGSLIDTQSRVDLTEKSQKGLRATALASVKESDAITFAPEKVKHNITVFTDIDCGYCRKLHQEMPKYHEEGISVRYLFYPRSGPKSASFVKAESVWCANDKKAAMNSAKAGESITPKGCDNPIQEQYDLGGQLGVTGTPAIFTEDGTLLPGYIPAKRLGQYLDSLSGGS